MKNLIFIIVLFASGCGNTITKPDEIKYTNSEVFESLNDAIYHIVENHNKNSVDSKTEYIGFLLSNGEKYYYTLSKGNMHSTKAKARISSVRIGYRVIAVWHTHAVDNENSDYFSEHDVHIANRLKVPNYMINSKNIVSRYNPHGDLINMLDARRLGLNPRKDYALGKIVF